VQILSVGEKMSETKTKLSVWKGRVVILSLLLFFFAIPHTLEDFALGEPAKNGVPAEVLSFVVAGMFALQGLALFWAGFGPVKRIVAVILSTRDWEFSGPWQQALPNCLSSLHQAITALDSSRWLMWLE
jgi:hypothetical protein